MKGEWKSAMKKNYASQCFVRLEPVTSREIQTARPESLSAE